MASDMQSFEVKYLNKILGLDSIPPLSSFPIPTTRNAWKLKDEDKSMFRLWSGFACGVLPLLALGDLIVFGLNIFRFGFGERRFSWSYLDKERLDEKY
jgi:hypothetical protein